jgi:hypothetical protein
MTENEKSASVISGTPTVAYLQFASILLNGLEKLAEIQKSALAVYAETTQNSADSLKPVFPVPPVSLFEMAEQAIREFLQIQVRLLDLMLSQSAASREAIRSQPDMDFEKEVARLMFDSTDCLLSMQKKAVEFITHQNQTLAAELRQATDIEDHLAEPVQPDTAAIIEAQKKFWDVTLKPFKMWKAESSQGAGI